MAGRPSCALLLLAVLALASALPSSGSGQARNPAVPSLESSVPGPSTHSRVFLPGQPLFPSTGSESQTYYVGAEEHGANCSSDSDCSFPTNSGAQATIQVVNQQVTGCLSYWIGDDSSADIWGQVGYYICNGSTPLAFYQIWDLVTYSILTTGESEISPGYHKFSMYVDSGTSWIFAVDGNVIGTYDMGANSSMPGYPVQALSEEGYVSRPWNPEQVTFSSAIQTYNLGTWSPSLASAEYFDGCDSDGHVGGAGYYGPYSCWGVQGNLQNSTIPSDSILVGGDTPLILPGSLLWNTPTSQSGASNTASSASSSAAAIISWLRFRGLARGARAV